jgi:hypothetical protein
MPTHRIINTLFTPGAQEQMNVAVMPVHRWIDWNVSGHGTISILDARDAGDSAAAQVEEDLRRQPADFIFLFDDGESSSARPSAANFMLHLQDDVGGAMDDAKVIGVLSKSAAQLKKRSRRGQRFVWFLLKVINSRKCMLPKRAALSVLTGELRRGQDRDGSVSTRCAALKSLMNESNRRPHPQPRQPILPRGLRRITFTPGAKVWDLTSAAAQETCALRQSYHARSNVGMGISAAREPEVFSWLGNVGCGWSPARRRRDRSFATAFLSVASPKGCARKYLTAKLRLSHWSLRSPGV